MATIIDIFRRLDLLDFLKGTLTRNLKLKILSLLLAFVLWFYIDSETMGTVTLSNVEVKVRPAAEKGLEIDPPILRIERLVLSGPRNKVQNLTIDSPGGVVILDVNQPGEVQIQPGDIKWMGLSTDVSVESNFNFYPNKVRVMRLTSKWVPVEPKLDLIRLSTGANIEPSSVHANPNEVEIFGAEYVLQNITKVETEPAQIAGTFESDTDVTRSVRIKTPPNVRCDTTVNIIANVKLEENTRELKDLDIFLLRTSANLNIFELKQKTVSLTFSGPKADVANLAKTNVQVYLDVRDVNSAGDFKLPLQVQTPKGISLVGKPPEIGVTVKIME